MKLSALRFDNPNNSCQSLRILAELVRRGDVLVTVSSTEAADCEPNSADLMVGFGHTKS